MNCHTDKETLLALSSLGIGWTRQLKKGCEKGLSLRETSEILYGKKIFSAREKIPKLLEITERENIKIIFPETFPALLKELPYPPIVLYARGNVDLLHRAGVSLVGTRTPSIAAGIVATTIAAKMAALKLVTVSGFAHGIDSIVHEKTLLSGGNTIAVLGRSLTGLRVEILYQQALENRRILYISELAPGIPTQKHHFPMRNRIIAALTLHTFFLSGSLKSGGLITANMALDLGREVITVSHDLLQNNEGGDSLASQGARNALHYLELQIYAQAVSANYKSVSAHYLGSGEWLEISADRSSFWNSLREELLQIFPDTIPDL